MHVEPDRADVGPSFSKYLLIWFRRLWSAFWALATLSIALIVDIFIVVAKPFFFWLKKLVQPEEGKDSREWLITAAILVLAFLISWIRVAYLLYRDRDTDAKKKERLLSDELLEVAENLKSCRNELAAKAPRIKVNVKQLYALTVAQGVPIWAYVPAGQLPRHKTAATLPGPPACVVAMRLEVSNTGPASNILRAELSIETAAGPLVAHELVDPSQFRIRRFEVVNMSRGAWAPEPGETIVRLRGRGIPHFSELEGNLTEFVEGVTRPPLNSNLAQFGWLVFRVKGADADVVNRSVVKLTIVDAQENAFVGESSPDDGRAVTGSDLVSAEDANPSQ